MRPHDGPKFRALVIRGVRLVYADLVGGCDWQALEDGRG